METMSLLKKSMLITLSVVGLAACDGQKAEEQEEPVNEEAYINEIREKDSVIQLIFSSMDDIEAELVKAKEKEGLVSLNSPYPEQPGTPQPDRIIQDIQLLSVLLEENRKKIEEYKRAVGSYEKGKKNFTSRIAEFETMLSERDASIAGLKEQIAALEFERGVLTQRVDSLRAETAVRDEVIKQKEEKLLTAYMTKGTRKELKNKGIIKPTGGVLGIGRTSTVNPVMDKTQFTTLNVAVVTSIPVNSKKAKLISTHPPSSYVLNRDGDEITTLEIIDVEEFWKNSKYLVLQTN